MRVRGDARQRPCPPVAGRPVQGAAMATPRTTSCTSGAFAPEYCACTGRVRPVFRTLQPAGCFACDDPAAVATGCAAQGDSASRRPTNCRTLPSSRSAASVGLARGSCCPGPPGASGSCTSPPGLWVSDAKMCAVAAAVAAGPSVDRKLADLCGSELSAAQVGNLLTFVDRNSAQRRSETC